jgi:hypothetical protein
LIRSSRILVSKCGAIALCCIAILSGYFVLHADAQQTSSKNFGRYLQENASSIGDIETITTSNVPSKEYLSPTIAILSRTPQKHWSVRIVEVLGKRIVPVWKSEKLPDRIGVIDASDFKIETIEGGLYLTLSGCVPHLCGFPGYYGVFLYSFSTHKAYFADISGSTSEETCIDFSQELKLAGSDARKATRAYINRAVVRNDVPMNIPECPIPPK